VPVCCEQFGVVECALNLETSTMDFELLQQDVADDAQAGDGIEGGHAVKHVGQEAAQSEGQGDAGHVSQNGDAQALRENPCNDLAA